MPGSDDVTSLTDTGGGDPAPSMTAVSDTASPQPNPAPQPNPSPQLDAASPSPQPGKKAKKEEEEDEKKEVSFEDEVEKKAKKSVVGQSAAELSGPAATMMKMAASLQETFGDVQDASMSVVKSGMGALAQKAADAYQAYKAGKDDGKEETPANLSPPANPEEPPAGLSQSSTARMDALSAESQQPSGPDVSSSDLTDAASMAPR